MLIRLGYTEDCPGCEAAKFGYIRNHHKSCRGGVEDELNKCAEWRSRLDKRDKRPDRPSKDSFVVKADTNTAPKVLSPNAGIDDDIAEEDKEARKEVESKVRPCEHDEEGNGEA